MGETTQTEPRESAPPNPAQNTGTAGGRSPGIAEPKAEAIGRPHAVAILLGFVVILAVAGFFLWKYYSIRESTDDAEIEGHIHPISARVGGTVTAVRFHTNEFVESGQALVEIDPKDYQVAVQRAEADLAEAEAALAGSRISVPIAATNTSSEVSGAEAGIEEARANLSSSEKDVAAAEARLRAAGARIQESQANAQKAVRDLDRMKLLISKDEISQQQFDSAVAANDSLRAAVESAQADAAASEQALRAAQSHVERDRARLSKAQAEARSAGTAPQQMALIRSRADSAAARVQMAKAALEQARLNLSYTTIRAPLGGQISKRNVETGLIVQPGQPLFAIVSSEDITVQANFKETQLKNIRPGQPVTVSVDAFGGRKYRAHVDSISAATGAKFSLLPPENATGNYVKVVQRIPVKITFEPGQDPEHLLRPGMSVVPTVMTK